jgi:hypothetical protein
MTEINFKSAGVSARTINLTGPTAIEPTGIPAGVIGTSAKGPAFVPVTVPTMQDFVVKFGQPTDNAFAGPLAVSEWLANQQSATFLRVLGVGDGTRRQVQGPNAGRVNGGGFIVGDEQPQDSLGGNLGPNPFANAGGVPGRAYFLCSFMAQSPNSQIFTDAGLAASGLPFVRGVLFAASGVLPSLSTSWGMATNDIDPGNNVAGTDLAGALTGSVNLNAGRQEFVMFLNGHQGSPQYPNTLTASFDAGAPNYLSNIFNTDPLKIEEAGHLLYTHYPVHPSLAVVTGSDVLVDTEDFDGFEPVAFIVPGAQNRNEGTPTAPNFDNFEDRFRTPRTSWFISQEFGGEVQDLFRVHSLNDGVNDNQNLKISIENILPGGAETGNPYGTFDLVVRNFNDSDSKRVVIEGFRGLSLNPSSPRYIAKVIGDYHTFFNFDARSQSQKLVTDGEYPNVSRFIRVEMSELVASGEADPTALPMGFRGLPKLNVEGPDALVLVPDDAGVFTGTDVSVPTTQIPVPFRENIAVGVSPNLSSDRSLYWGLQFEQKINPVETNISNAVDPLVRSTTTYFPDFHTVYKNVVDTDTDDLFTLRNIRVTYNPSDPDEAVTTVDFSTWEYVRAGNITTNSGNGTRALRVSDLRNSAVRQVAKFSTCLFGGFNGVRIFNKDTATLTDKAIFEEMNFVSRGLSSAPTVSAYTKALDMIADETSVDIQLLTIPGIRQSIITDRALQLTEQRFDALYLMDIVEYDTNNAVLTKVDEQLPSVRFTADRFGQRGINSSFGAAYYPDVNLRDTITGTTRRVPPSVAVLGAFGLNDAVGFPWFAPAGFTRGALETTNDSTVKLSRNNMDDLQDVRINPLVSFAGSDGVVVWGQRTLLDADSALERVNVRRLLVDVRRKVKRVSNRILFEQGRAETLARFSALVNPILKRIQDQNGLEKFLVRIDTTTTTQSDIENRTIRGKIFLVPSKTLEFLSLDFVLTNEGSFANVTG